MSNVPERIWIHPADPWHLYITHEMPDTVGYRRDDQVCVYKPDGRGYVEITHGREIRLRPWSSVADWVTCPWCSKRIRVEEAE